MLSKLRRIQQFRAYQRQSFQDSRFLRINSIANSISLSSLAIRCFSFASLAARHFDVNHAGLNPTAPALSIHKTEIKTQNALDT